MVSGTCDLGARLPLDDCLFGQWNAVSVAAARCAHDAHVNRSAWPEVDVNGVDLWDGCAVEHVRV
jgi:hypothetical protein